MPFKVSDAASPESIQGKFNLELVPRNCQLEDQSKIKLKSIPTFQVSSDFIAYASPDSTYAVTKRLLDGAQKEIVIGIYDFSANYMSDILLNAMQRGVKVTLKLDIDSDGEKKIFNQLQKFGCKTVEAPSCASKIISYFPSSHEKVIVIDKTWTLVQSGNYSKNSIPLNEKDGGEKESFVKGNRDMGVAIKSKPLADFFLNVLQKDIKLQLNATRLEQLIKDTKVPSSPFLVEFVPKQIPTQLFPSKLFNPKKKIKVTPVLTPDNYMDIIPFLLEGAKKSILIENQYIKSSQSEVSKLLAAIKTALTNNPSLDVRIILGKLFDKDDYDKEVKNIANISKAFGLKLSTNIRYIDTKRFIHCHNKLLIVDNMKVLISSQNWSNSGVDKNREAGLLIDYPELTKYYSKIFESDWSTALKGIPKPGKATISPQSLAKGNYVEVVAADYQEV